MKKYVYILALLFASPAFAQHPWDNILSPARARDWTVVGLPGTITYGTGGTACPNATVNCVETNPNPWTPATRTQSGSTVTCANSSADPGTINTALAAAFPGQFVLLGATTCLINANVTMANGVSLRGTSPQSTILNVTGASTQFTFNTCCGGINSGVLSATSYAAGTNSVTINSATCSTSCTELVVGNVAYFEQCDTGWTGSGTSFSTDPSCTSGSYADNLGLWVCGIDFAVCSTNSSGTGGHFYLRQSVLITGVVNNGAGSYTVTFSPGFDTPTWSSNNNALLFWVPRNTSTFGAGLEDLTVNFSFSTGEKISTGGYAWRVKGNRITGFPSVSDLPASGLGGLIFNNYIYGNNPNNLGTNVSEAIVRSLGSSVLTMNNIVHGAVCVWADGQTSSSANAYNYCRDAATGFSTAIVLTHNPYESCRLDEGNSLSQIQYDDTHGTGDFCDTAFRNHVNMNDPPYIGYVSTNARGIQVDNYHRIVNIIGNAIESHGPNPNGATAYQGSSASVGNIFVIPSSDQLAQASLMRFANWDSITAATRYCVPGFAGFSSAPCSSTNATGLAASESGNTVTVTSTLNPGTATPTIVTMTGCSVSGYNGMFQVTVSSGSSFQYNDYGSSGLGAATGCTATLGNEVPTTLAGTGMSPFVNLVPASTTLPCSMFLTGFTSTSCTAFPSGGTGLSWWKVGTGCTITSSVSCSGSQVPPFPAIGPDVTGGPYAGGHAYATPAEIAFTNLPIDTTLQNTFTITGSSWTSGIETLTVSLASIDNGSNEHIMGGFQLSGVNAACIPAGITKNEIFMTGSSTTTVQYALTGNPGVSCTGSLLFPDILQFDERVFQADTQAGGTTPAPAVTMFAGNWKAEPIPAAPANPVQLTSTPAKSYVNSSGVSQNGLTGFAPLKLTVTGTNLLTPTGCTFDSKSVTCSCSASACTLTIPLAMTPPVTVETSHTWNINFPAVTVPPLPTLQ